MATLCHPLCHPSRTHAAHGLCRSCYRRKYPPASIPPAGRELAVLEAESDLHAAVPEARGALDVGAGVAFYDEVMLRAMRRRQEAAARIDVEFPEGGRRCP